jgi:hypothetical protein
VELLEERRLLSGNPMSPAASTLLVDNLYQTFLGRAPGASEERSWETAIQAGLSPAETAPQFLASPEYLANQVRDRYLQLLGRTPEPQAAAYWLQALRARRGSPDPPVAGLTDDQFTQALVSSPEYDARNGQTTSSFVNALYREVLGRAPDADGFSYWVKGTCRDMQRFPSGKP